jgi:endogenous inhibitor of DNA gyrase (YacG/DUF329 family)
MASIQTPCPDCGREAHLDPAVVAVLPGSESSVAHYAFVCPRCEAPVVKTADAHAVRLLRTARASVAGATECVLARHPEAPGAGAAFTPDDLIDFHQLLTTDGWFALVASARP